MTQGEQNTETAAPVWSALNLPKAKASGMQRFSVLAIAVGLIVIVMASAVKGPIRTTGTQIEPARYASQVPHIERTDKTEIAVADGTN